MGSTPAERALQARLAAHESWAATTDRTARTATARAAFERRFLSQADGDPVRAESLRRAYYTRLALKSAVSRRKARELTVQAEAAEAELAEAGGSDG
jgi:hypothetical protein